MRHKNVFWCLLLTCALLLSGCSSNPENTEASTENTLSKMDMTKWQYEEESDVYWQTGIVYCASPADEEYENLGIYVPGAYMTGTENGDGTYTCEIQLLDRDNYELLIDKGYYTEEEVLPEGAAPREEETDAQVSAAPTPDPD